MIWDIVKNKTIFKVTPSVFYHPGHKLIEFGWLWWSFVIKLK